MIDALLHICKKGLTQEYPVALGIQQRFRLSVVLSIVDISTGIVVHKNTTRSILCRNPQRVFFDLNRILSVF